MNCLIVDEAKKKNKTTNKTKQKQKRNKKTNTEGKRRADSLLGREDKKKPAEHTLNFSILHAPFKLLSSFQPPPHYKFR